ncbi:DinB family protein [Brevibacillus humidisoli]|uniref:DinB family protein n=1 Tax=Brevibacillus humidisoli TaxID=2895522 RepID=UPI001E645E2F|nr:DinB family protein [Brevibacillus humidisoli]UFJ39720.1 DinB family protein [Brevibacillus humidisoli]
MISMTEWLLDEFTEEARSTRRVLKRIPEDKLSWKPHPKSMSLGELALHVAVLPGELAEFFSESERKVPTVPLPEASSLNEILTAFDKSESIAKTKLSAWKEDDMLAEWKMVHGEETVISAPRYMMVRSTMLNHWYHHRGQLVVYLRLLDIPVPAVYGSSADEELIGS